STNDLEQEPSANPNAVIQMKYSLCLFILFVLRIVFQWLEPDLDTACNRFGDQHLQVGLAVDAGFRIIRQVLVDTPGGQIRSADIDAQLVDLQLLQHRSRQIIAELQIPQPDIVAFVQPSRTGLAALARIAINDLRYIGLIARLLPGRELAAQLIDPTHISTVAVEIVVPGVEDIVAVLVVELEVQHPWTQREGVFQATEELRGGGKIIQRKSGAVIIIGQRFLGGVRIPLRRARLRIDTGPYRQVVFLQVVSHRILELAVRDRSPLVQVRYPVRIMRDVELDLPLEKRGDHRPGVDQQLDPLVHQAAYVLVLRSEAGGIGEGDRGQQVVGRPVIIIDGTVDPVLQDGKIQPEVQRLVLFPGQLAVAYIGGYQTRLPAIVGRAIGG